MNRSTAMADEALALLKDAFWQLDTAQRMARGYVEEYAALLPDRARTSGLVPRHRILDEAADAHMAEYLSVLDTHPLAAKTRPDVANTALRAFRHLEPRLRTIAGELEQFVLDYDVEFQRVGRELACVDREKEAARVALQRATTLWQELRSQGYESRLADQGLARARVAGRGVEAWVPERGVDELRKVGSLVSSFADDVERAATEFPGRVQRARRRAPALKTWEEAISTRSLRIPEQLGALRREFSSGNWSDLERHGNRVTELLVQAQTPLSRFLSALGQKRWDDALLELEQVEQALARADQAVDEPRDRLLTLRKFKADPKPRIDRARFAIRDAQMLVMGRAGGASSSFAKQLDQLAAQVSAIGDRLGGVHPDYLAALTELERMTQHVRTVVDRYRGSSR